MQAIPVSRDMSRRVASLRAIDTYVYKYQHNEYTNRTAFYK